MSLRERWEMFATRKATKILARTHTRLFRATGGRRGATFLGVPTLLLDHVGRKSGKAFTTPLLYMHEGDDLIVVASQGGLPEHPQWYRNLVASPDTQVQRPGEEPQPVRARTATSDERAELWPRLVEIYPGYEDYQAKTDRVIPVVVLEPR